MLAYCPQFNLYVVLTVYCSIFKILLPVSNWFLPLSSVVLLRIYISVFLERYNLHTHIQELFLITRSVWTHFIKVCSSLSVSVTAFSSPLSRKQVTLAEHYPQQNELTCNMSRWMSHTLCHFIKSCPVFRNIIFSTVR